MGGGSSGGGDRTLRAWDVKDRGPLRKVGEHGAIVTALAVAGATLCSADADGFVGLWDLETLEAAGELEAKPSIYALAVVGPVLFAARGDGETVVAWDVSTKADAPPYAAESLLAVGKKLYLGRATTAQSASGTRRGRRRRRAGGGGRRLRTRPRGRGRATAAASPRSRRWRAPSSCPAARTAPSSAGTRPARTRRWATRPREGADLVLTAPTRSWRTTPGDPLQIASRQTRWRRTSRSGGGRNRCKSPCCLLLGAARSMGWNRRDALLVLRHACHEVNRRKAGDRGTARGK